MEGRMYCVCVHVDLHDLIYLNERIFVEEFNESFKASCIALHALQEILHKRIVALSRFLDLLLDVR